MSTASDYISSSQTPAVLSWSSHQLPRSFALPSVASSVPSSVRSMLFPLSCAFPPTYSNMVSYDVLLFHTSTGHAYLATTSWYFQPTSWLNLPTVQYFLPGFSLKIRNACGTTMRFFLSYGPGTPSKTFRRSMAAAPRAVLCGIIPRTVL